MAEAACQQNFRPDAAAPRRSARDLAGGQPETEPPRQRRSGGVHPLKVMRYVRVLSPASNSGLPDPRLGAYHPGCHGVLSRFPDRLPVAR